MLSVSDGMMGIPYHRDRGAYPMPPTSEPGTHA